MPALQCINPDCCLHVACMLAASCACAHESSKCSLVVQKASSELQHGLSSILCSCALHADPLPVDLMYYAKSNTKNGKVLWVSLRGSNKLEGFHRFWNMIMRAPNHPVLLLALLFI